MIENNIKRLRKKSGMSQEELAVGLSIVRQTVSKWENGLSVPDAEMVIKMSELFHVSVNEILGISKDEKIEDIAEKLARANELLAQKNRLERISKVSNQKRGLLLLLSFCAMIIALSVRNETLSICLIGICGVATLIILYRNLTLLTSVTTKETRLRTLKATTIFDIAMLLICVLLAILSGLDMLPGEAEWVFAMLLINVVIIFSGIISPRLPFNRHTGLRLPWTVADEDTWNVAHKTIGYTALPIALLYAVGTLTIRNFDVVTAVAVIAWIGIPALISFVFYYKKMRGAA